MLNVSKKQRVHKYKYIGLPTRFLLPENNPLYSFNILTFIGKLCDDETLFNLTEVCQYFRSAITIQPQFEARLWKIRFLKLSLKYRVLRQFKAKEEDESSLNIDPRLGEKPAVMNFV